MTGEGVYESTNSGWKEENEVMEEGRGRIEWLKLV